jgi:hypothetical protein
MSKPPHARPRSSLAPAALAGAAAVCALVAQAAPATDAEARSLRTIATHAQPRDGTRLPGLWRQYLRLKRQTPPDDAVEDRQADDGGAPDSLAVVLPEVLQTVGKLRAGAPTGLFDSLDAAQRAYTDALQRLHAGDTGVSPDFMVAVLQAVADGQSALDQALDLAAVLDPPAVGLLLPAVQAAREAARRQVDAVIDLALKAGVSEARIAPAQTAQRDADALFAAGDYGGAGQQHAAGFGLAANTVTFSMDRFEQNLREVFDAHSVGWAYALSQGGQLARSGAGGLARTGADQPSIPQSATKKMHVASVSKTLTAIVLLRRLHEMGMSEDTAIGPWLPADWARGEGVDAITFGELMRHFSGFGQNGLCGGSYDTLRQMVGQAVLPEPACAYCNANYGLVRVLLPRMLGVDLAALPTDPAALSSAMFLSYAQLIFDSAGVPFSCDPQAVDPTVQYFFPDTGNPGFVEPPNSLNCGGVGVQISATDVARTLSYLRYTQDLLPTSRFEAMKSRYYGFRDPQYASYNVGAFGIYSGHGGAWNHDNGDLGSCVMMFPIHVEAAVVINSSPVGGYPNFNHPCGEVRRAFDNAWVAP